MNNVENIQFLDRSFEEVEGGYYDGNGCYRTPNGSFWDENGIYFNCLGKDKNGGTYDEFGVYNPGEDWNEEFNCYNNEMEGDVTDEYKKIFNDNLNQELIEGYDYYERYFKTENIEDLDDDYHPYNINIDDQCTIKTSVNSVGSEFSTPNINSTNSNYKNSISNINSESVYTENFNTLNYQLNQQGNDTSSFNK